MKLQPCAILTILSLALATQTFGLQVKPNVAATRKAGEVVLEQASLTTPETGEVKFELGTLYVPENRADPKSRIIGLGFARFRALQPSGTPPTFHLPGGPGDSYLRGLKRDNRQLARWIKHINLYRGVGDMVMVDQRGNSERGEILKLKYRTQEQPLDQPTSLARATAAFVEASRAAVSEYEKKGIDLRGYTVKECADDVNDLRRALGYDRITLVGTSFGSQWSFAIMRRHPDVIARALLSGVEPLDYGYDMPSHVFCGGAADVVGGGEGPASQALPSTRRADDGGPRGLATARSERGAGETLRHTRGNGGARRLPA